MSSSAPIGFSQFIKRAWLDFTVQQQLDGQSPADIRAGLNEFLSDQVSVGSSSRNSNRQRVIGILLKIWVKVPKPIKSFRDEGLALLKHTPESTNIAAIHWGMAMAAYPFFAMAAENVGRLLRLQQYVSTTQLQKRLREKMGERDSVSVAARKLIYCWEEWGMLINTDKKRIYAATETLRITDSQLTTWLLESALIAREGQTAVLHSLVNYTPALFPFNLSSSYFMPNERLETFSQGVNEVSVAFSNY